MAAMQVDRRRGGGVPTWALAGLAVLLVAGFMAWLAMTAEPSTPGGAGDGTEGDTLAARASEVPAVDLATFADDPRLYEGGEIRLVSAPVDSRLGERAFWLKLPNQGLYLVRAEPVVAGTVQGGQTVTVAGDILPMTDSVVAAWVAEAAITADQEMEARYATSYIDAWYVAPSTEQQQPEAIDGAAVDSPAVDGAAVDSVAQEG